jgi:transketolase
MRLAFAQTLAELAERDARILLLTGDLGYLALESFSEKFPDRFFNVGVAEQNMVGLATGLAADGFLPFLYSIATFAALRPYEFIRNGPVHHRLPVRIIGVGGGFEYGHAGATHYGLEDVAVMRTQPGITVIAPADYEQARTALLATWDVPGPVYYRIGKDDKTVIPGLDGRFELGRAQLVREGDDLLIITMGSIASEVIAAADALARHGVSCTVMIVASINPAPVDDLAEWLSRFPVALTVEAHYVNGGVGSLVSEVVAELGINCRIVRCGVKRTPDGVVGGQDYLHRVHGLSSERLVEAALRARRLQREVIQ